MTLAASRTPDRGSRLRIGILATHPVQYQAPWFRALAAHPGVDLTVYYCLIPDPRQQGVGFGLDFLWDLPLLEGYRSEVLQNVARRPAFNRFFGCDTPGIDRLVREGGFDAFIILGWSVKSCLQALWACRRSKTAAIARGESNAMRRRPWNVRLLHRLLLGQYAACLVIGRSNREFYRSNGVVEEKLFEGRYCVDNERFAREALEMEPSRQRIRAQWGVPESAYTFLFCGKFIPKKRPLDLLEATTVALRCSPSSGFHILMVGEGELRDASEALARERGLPVSFAGFLNQREVARAYVAADCLVLPSDYGETWGLVVNEAMACGLPAIVSDRVGCHPDLVRRDTGAVFPFGDVGILAETLAGFAARPEGSRELGRRAKDRIREYSVANLVKGTLDAARYAAVSGSPVGKC